MTHTTPRSDDLAADYRPLWQDSSDSYSTISRLNHWITATVFLGTLGLGLVMAYGGLEREAVTPLMAWHKFFGVLVLVHGLWRVAWRMRQGFPEPVASMPRWQEVASKAVHVGLLAAIVAMPLSGILMTIAGGRALAVWDITLLPSLGEIAWLDSAAGVVHETAPPVLLLLLALHIGGALEHHFMDRDPTLRRMVKG